MLAYKDAVDGLYSFSVAEFTRRQELSAKIETRTAQGKWGLTEKDEEDLNSPNPSTSAQKPSGLEGIDSPFPIAGLSRNADDAMLPALRKRLTDLSTDFKTRVNNLLGDLAVQPDVDMKFLAVVMNFNDVYTPRKRRREHHKGAEKKTPAAQTETGRAGKTAVATTEEKGKGKEEPVGAATRTAAKSSRVNAK